jgi:hypothetical protein
VLPCTRSVTALELVWQRQFRVPRPEPGRPGGQHRMGTAQTRRLEPFFPLSPATFGGDRRGSRGIIYLIRHSLQWKAPPLASEVL